MSLSYPLSLPSTSVAAAVTIRAKSNVGMSMSPFSFAQNVYVHQGEMWELDWQMPPMKRADAEDWVAFLLGLNGREGTFLAAPDPVNVLPRGTWTGSPVMDGASQTGKTLRVTGLSVGATGKAGDWLQLGSGSSARLHKVTKDFMVGSPISTSVEVWPRLRESPSDAAVITVSSPKGLFRLNSNVREWTLELAMVYGIRFSAIEAL